MAANQKGYGRLAVATVERLLSKEMLLAAFAPAAGAARSATVPLKECSALQQSLGVAALTGQTGCSCGAGRANLVALVAQPASAASKTVSLIKSALTWLAKAAESRRKPPRRTC